VCTYLRRRAIRPRLDDKEAPMGRLVVNNAMTVNGAFEAVA